jgi:hypothetical protein
MSNEVTSAPSICMVLSTLTLALLRRAAEFVPVASAPEPMATASVTAAAPNPTTVVIVDALDRASTSAFSGAAIEHRQCGRLSRASQMSGFFVSLFWCIFLRFSSCEISH